MKKIMTLALCLLLTISLTAQSEKDIVKQASMDYFESMVNQDFDGILNAMYPKVFDAVSKDQMKMGMQQMFNNPEMKIEFLSNDIKSISDAVMADEKTYRAVFYNSVMQMIFVSEQDKPEADKKSFLDFMKTTMDTQFGAEHVTANYENTSLKIVMDSNMFAIKDPAYEGWKFIGNDDNMKQLIDTIIPESVRTELLKEQTKKNK